MILGELCDVGITQFTGTNSQNGRLFRDGIPSACPGKAYPGLFNPGTPYFYETFMYTNTTGATACVTVNFDPNPNSNIATDCDTNAHASAYLTSYDPMNQGTNFVGDVGSSITDSFSFDVPAATDLFVVVTNTAAEEICDFSFSMVNIACDGAPLFSKIFAPNPINPGGVSTLTFTIDNSAGVLDANNLDFTDNLPGGVTVATPSNAATTCTGGTLTAAPGSSTITYTGGSLLAGGTCTVTVDVTSSTPGSAINTTGDLTSSLGDSGTATDTLTVSAVTTFNVASATGSGNISGSISDSGGTCTITSVTATTAAAVAGSGPPGVTFPHGLLDFQIDSCSPGDTVDFSITYPSPLPAGSIFWKYGPTPTNPTPDWYMLPGAIVAGSTATYSVTDGGIGDDDLTPDGSIADPGGPGVGAAAPTMPFWALAILAALLLGAATLAMKAGTASPRS